MRIPRTYEEFRLRFAQRTFDLWQMMGFHVTPVHYYQPVPDTRALPESLWKRRSEMAGVRMDIDAQAALVGELAEAYKAEYDAFPRHRTSDPSQYFTHNGLFESVDAELYYALIRKHRPRRIIEAGAGYSTFVAAQAALRNQEETGRECVLMAVDPNPTQTFLDGFAGLSLLVATGVQELPLAEFESLEANDILFIDSSHVVRTGGDVVWELLEIVPRLAPGVLVHFHDIYMPADYYRHLLVKDHKFFTEQYILQAFLAFNAEFEVLLGTSVLHMDRPELLEKCFASYSRAKHWPGSLWIRRRG